MNGFLISEHRDMQRSFSVTSYDEGENTASVVLPS